MSSRNAARPLRASHQLAASHPRTALTTSPAAVHWASEVPDRGWARHGTAQCQNWRRRRPWRKTRTKTEPGAWVPGRAGAQPQSRHVNWESVEQNILLRIQDFDDPRQEWRRLFSELYGTFLLVIVAAGGGMMSQAFPGAISRTAAVVAPA